jgi:hypothetical protein
MSAIKKEKDPLIYALMKEIADLKESYADCDEDRRNAIDEIEMWRFRWEKLKEHNENAIRPHLEARTIFREWMQELESGSDKEAKT